MDKLAVARIEHERNAFAVLCNACFDRDGCGDRTLSPKEGQPC